MALITNGARLTTALAGNEEELYLGAVQYNESNWFQIGMPNAFDTVNKKRVNYRYEQEVRVVHWDTSNIHDALVNFNWNDETMRFDDLVFDPNPIKPGMLVDCDMSALIEKVIVSPYAPPWYAPMIARLRDQLNLNFAVQSSRLLAPPLEPS